MLFLGTTFTGMKHSFDATPPKIKSGDRVELSNGIFDELYLTKEADSPYSTSVPEMWDFDTLIHANFSGNLFAGNADFSLETTSHLRLKRRRKNGGKWITLLEKPIYALEDFMFTYIDRYVRSNSVYEYAVVSVLNGIEGSYNIGEIETGFDGLYLVDKEKIYRSIMNIDSVDTTRNKPSAVVVTIDRIYPFVISNGISDYEEGTVSATFIPMGEDGCSFTYDNAWEYREGLKKWLFNGKPKVIKHEDGRMWLVSIGNSISENERNHPDNVVTSFKFTEVGEPESNSDLYNNGFIESYVKGE